MSREYYTWPAGGVSETGTQSAMLRGVFVTQTQAPPPVGGGSTMKVWSGGAWTQKPLKRWNGTAWVATVLKRWNGTSWVVE